MATRHTQGRPENSGRPLRFSGELQFQNHRRTAQRTEDTYFTAFIAPALDARWRFAAVASRARVGGAVQRNRAKRLLRSAFLQLYQEVATPFGLVLYAKASLLQATTADILPSLQKVFQRALDTHTTR